jgi:hypothetical protein
MVVGIISLYFFIINDDLIATLCSEAKDELLSQCLNIPSSISLREKTISPNRENTECFSPRLVCNVLSRQNPFIFIRVVWNFCLWADCTERAILGDTLKCQKEKK